MEIAKEIHEEVQKFIDLPLREQERLIAIAKHKRDVFEQYKEIKNKIAEANFILEHLQHNCGHHGVKKTHRADTGNFCQDDDRYWTEFKCDDCGKFWSEEGSK